MEASVDLPQLARNERFRLQDAGESQQPRGRDGQGSGQPRNRYADLPSPETRQAASLRDSDGPLSRTWGLQLARSPITAPTNSANSRTSSSVVSNEHIHRTTDSSSLHT